MTDEEKAAQLEEDRLAQEVAQKEFESGFSDTPVELTEAEKKISETPVVTNETDESEDESSKEEKPADEEKPAEEKPAEVKPAAQLSNDQILGLMDKAKSVDEMRVLVQKLQDETRGRFGSLADQLKQIQAATAAGQSVDVSDEDFSDLIKLVPDIAPAVIAGLKKTVGKMKGTATPAPVETQEQFEERVKPVAIKIAREISAQERLLEKQESAKAKVAEKHAKWGETVKDTTFQTWLQEQPHAYVEKFNASWEPSVVIDGLDKFYEAQKAKDKPKEEVKPAVKQNESRAQRLKEATPPKGGASVPLGKKTKTPEEEFAEGYNS